MKPIAFLLVLLFSISASAQVKKGESIFKNFDLSEKNTKLTDLVVCDTINALPKKRGLDRVRIKTFNKDSFCLKKSIIGHQNPSPFIAFSCRWVDAASNSNNTSLYIRFSKDSIQWEEYKKINTDEHFEGPKNSFVSDLSFLDKEIKFYQVKIITNRQKKGKRITHLMLNFFNPGKEHTALATPALLRFPIVDNSLADIDWENQLKLDYTGVISTDFSLKKNSSNKSAITGSTNRTEQPLACPCPLPSYITRTQWNCPQGQGIAAGVVTNPAVTHLIIHHSAGANTAADWNAVVLSIWNLHTGTNGYSDIGYNWLIAPNGQLYEGRGSNAITDHVQGAHFCGFNPATMGTCMMGTYTSIDITGVARTTLNNILAWKSCQAGIPVTGTALHVSSGLVLNRISGHRDGCATECPGTVFYNSLPQVRTEVTAAINACAPPVCVPSLQLLSTGCPGNTISFSPTNILNGGTAPTFLWFVNSIQVQNSPNFILNNAINGDKVYARMTSNASCANPLQVNSDTITINCIVTTSVNNIDGLDYCRIAPNPNRGNFTVNMHLTKSTLVQYTLTNATGQAIFTTEKERVLGLVAKRFENIITKTGIYFLRIVLNGKIMVRKIVVQ